MPSDALSPAEREYDAALAMLRAARNAPRDSRVEAEGLGHLAPMVGHCAATARAAGIRPERMLVDIKQAMGLPRTGAVSSYEDDGVRLFAAAIDTYFGRATSE